MSRNFYNVLSTRHSRKRTEVTKRVPQPTVASGNNTKTKRHKHNSKTRPSLRTHIQGGKKNGAATGTNLYASSVHAPHAPIAPSRTSNARNVQVDVNRNTSVFQESARTSANVANHSVAETEKLDLEISKLTDALYQEKEKAEDRSQRVLEILQAKDEEIKKLTHENEDLQMQLKEAHHSSMKTMANTRLKFDQLDKELEQCQREKQNLEYEMETLRASLQELHGGHPYNDGMENNTDKTEHADGNNGTRISNLNAKIKDQDEQIEVLISEVARLRSENESKPSGSLLESAGISSRANSKHVIKGLQNALEEQRQKIASLTRDLDATQDLKNEHAEQALQLERFKEIAETLEGKCRSKTLRWQARRA